MGMQDVNLKVEKPQDKDAEIARLRQEVERLQAKRDNDENSAFHRLRKTADEMKSVQAELAEARRKIAELQSKNVTAALTPEQLEALGQDGVKAVKAMIDMSVPQPAAVPQSSDEVSALRAELESFKLENQRQMLRQAYNANLVSWAAAEGQPGLFARLAPGGDLAEKWAAFAQRFPGAVAAYDSADTEGTKAFVRLFLYENPVVSQQTVTPSASGGFAPPADPNVYTPQMWKTDTDALDEARAARRISEADYMKGYAEANAKLSAGRKA